LHLRLVQASRAKEKGKGKKKKKKGEKQEVLLGRLTADLKDPKIGSQGYFVVVVVQCGSRK